MYYCCLKKIFFKLILVCLGNGQKDATAQDLWLENLEIWLCLLLVFGLVLTLEFTGSCLAMEPASQHTRA